MNRFLRTFYLFVIATGLAGICVGQSTMNFPVGAKSFGMGGSGYASALDGSALFYNPANISFLPRSGAFLYSRSSRNFYGRYDGECRYVSLSYGVPKLDRLTASVYINSINRGNPMEFAPDSSGIEVPTGRNYRDREITACIGMAYAVESPAGVVHAFGSSIKHFSRRELGGVGIGASTNAVELGYTCSRKRVNLALGIKNIGPNFRITKSDDVDTTVRLHQYGIPFSTYAGIGYKDTVRRALRPILKIALECTFEREFRREYLRRDPRAPRFHAYQYSIGADPFYKALFTDWGRSANSNGWTQFSWHTGANFDFKNVFSARCGVNGVYGFPTIAGGVGLNLFNHFKVDIYKFIPGDVDSRAWFDGWSLSFVNFHSWRESDREWWVDQ